MMQNVSAAFHVTGALKNPHIQSILSSSAWRKHLGLKRLQSLPASSQEQLLTLPDGTRLSGVHYATQAANASGILVLLLHGWEGSAQSSYINHSAAELLAAGFDVFALNFRDHGQTHDLNEGLFHSCRLQEVVDATLQIVQGYQPKRFFVAGFSLGGNIALKAAGELGEDAIGLFAGICAISPSIDLHASVESLARGINKIYEMHFLRGLASKIRHKSVLFPERFDVEKLKLVKTIKDFDDIFTAPDGGYGDADNYYTQASAINLIPNIRVPTLIISSKDDPIVPFESFLSDKLKTPFVTLLAPDWGGHSGFLHAHSEATGRDVSDKFWAEHRVVAFCLCKNSEGA